MAVKNGTSGPVTAGPAPVKLEPIKSKKSVAVAYLFWLFLGLTGIHHVYLEQDYLAMVWASTGGFFGFGWLADFWWIPTYVARCNRDPRLRDLLAVEKKYAPTPPNHYFLLTWWMQGMLVQWYITLVRFALQDESFEVPNVVAFELLSAGACFVAFFMINKCGPVVGKAGHATAGYAVARLAEVYFAGPASSSTLSTTFALLVFSYFRTWEEAVPLTRPRKLVGVLVFLFFFVFVLVMFSHLFLYIAYLSICLSIYLSIRLSIYLLLLPFPFRPSDQRRRPLPARVVPHALPLCPHGGGPFHRRQHLQLHHGG